MPGLTPRLLRAPPSRLRQIADYWQIDPELLAGPRPVAALLQELRDPWVVRSRLDRLDPPRLQVLDALLPRVEQPLGPRALQAATGLTTPQLRAIILEWVDGGLVLLQRPPAKPNTAGGGRVSVPVELADALRLARRAQGQPWPESLAERLAELDAESLQDVAEQWGVTRPRARKRPELLVTLRRVLSDPRLVQDWLKQLQAEDRAVLEAVCARQGWTSLAELRQSFPDATLRLAAQRLSPALVLEERYRQGVRGLVVWPEVRESLTTPLPALAAAAAPTSVRARDSGAAAAADLAIALGRLTQTPLALAGEESLPTRFARCWLAADARLDAEDELRAEFLLHVATQAGLLRIHGDQLRPAQSVGEWLAAGLPSQTRRLFRVWLRDWRWRPPGYVHGIDDPPLRRTLAAHLRLTSADGAWRAVEVWRRELRQVLPGRLARQTLAEHAPPLDAAVRHLIEIWTAGPPTWLGLVVGGEQPETGLPMLRVTPLGLWALGRGESPPTGRGRLQIAPDGRVAVPDPDAMALYHLARLAERDRTGWRLSQPALHRYLAHGGRLERAVQFLEQRGAEPPPPRLLERLRAWAASYQPVKLRVGLVLEMRSADELDALLERPEFAAQIARRLGPTAALIQDSLDARTLRSALRQAGYWVEGD